MVDTTAPTITIGALSGPTGGTYTALISLSEESTDFFDSDLSLTNATATLSGSGNSYTATLTPDGDGEVKLSVSAAKFSDAAGNGNVASNEVTAVFDTTPPTASFSPLVRTPTGYTTTLTFSEQVTGYSHSDLSLTNVGLLSFTGNGTVYNISITPAADGEVTVTLPAGVVTDASGNGNLVSNLVRATFDSTPPTITIGALSGPTGGKYTASITLSEASTDFVDSDLSLTNATATLSGSDTSYTATLTPDADGEIKLSVAANSFTDAAGNGNVVSNEVTATFDGTAPTITIGALSGPTGGKYTASITLSETSTDFVDSDLMLTNATATLSGSGTSYTATLTPDADGEIKLSVAANSFTDAAGNGNVVSNEVTATFDGTAPTITIGALSGPTGGKYTASITLSETSTDFVDSDLMLTNATATLSGSGTSYTATLTPDADGEIKLSVAANSFTDAAGNGNVVSNEVTATFDSTPPTITIGALSGPTGGVYTASITLSEASTDFVDSDLTLTNATATLSGSGASYTATLTPDADGEVKLSVAAGSFTDAAGNENVVSNEVSAIFDGTAPTITIGALSGPTGGAYTASITLSEASTDFVDTDLSLTNATATLSGSGTSYTATLTPDADGEIKLSVAANSFTDAAGIGNVVSNEVTAIFDGTAPTITIGALSGPTGGKYTASITLSETSTDFVDSDLTLINATATLSGSGTSYTATLTPDADGEVKLSVAAGSFTDAAGNENLVSNEVTTTFDGTVPTIVIGALSGPTDGTFTASITLSEASTDFEVGDLILTNATASLAGSGSSYTATLTPNSNGEVKLSVAAGSFTDAAGNASVVSNEVTAVFDGSRPTVLITGAPSSVNASSTFSVTITFSEDVTGFDGADITAMNATVMSLTGSGAVYQATMSASGSGTVNVVVPANVAYDSGNNANMASNLVEIADTTVDQTQELIASFMQNRANQLIRSQPGLSEFLSGKAQGGTSVTVSRGQGQFSYSTDPNYPVWLRAHGSWTSGADSKSRYMFGAIGSHQEVTPNLLLGAMLQFDHMEEDTGNASVNGNGWMVGPYFVAKSAERPIYFEGRLLYGESRNKVSPFGTYEDDFDTDRLLAQFKVSGEYDYGDFTKLYPFLDASYATDDQHSYVDSLGNLIPRQGVNLGQIEIGMDFKHEVLVSSGELELFGGVSGIWSRTGGQGYAATVSPDYEGGRGRIEYGLNRVFSAYQHLNASTFYDGIGASGYESFGFSLGYEMQF